MIHVRFGRMREMECGVIQIEVKQPGVGFEPVKDLRLQCRRGEIRTNGHD
jgi:hypothetical protein